MPVRPAAQRRAQPTISRRDWLAQQIERLNNDIAGNPAPPGHTDTWNDRKRDKVRGYQRELEGILAHEASMLDVGGQP